MKVVFVGDTQLGHLFITGKNYFNHICLIDNSIDIFVVDVCCHNESFEKTKVRLSRIHMINFEFHLIFSLLIMDILRPKIIL